MIDYTVSGFSKALGEMLLSDRERFEPEFRGRKIIEIGAGDGELLEPLLDLGVTEYCAVERLSEQVVQLWNRMLWLSGERGRGYDPRKVREIFRASQQSAIDRLVVKAREMERSSDLDVDELLGKYFVDEAEIIYADGVMMNLDNVEGEVNGIRRKFSLFYAPDLNEFLQAQKNESAITVSAGSLGMAFIPPEQITRDYAQRNSGYVREVAAQIYRITPKGSISLHTNAGEIPFYTAPFIEEETIRRKIFTFGHLGIKKSPAGITVLRKPLQPSPM